MINIAKGTTDPGVEFSHQSIFVKSYHKLIKIQLQNLNHTWASKFPTKHLPQSLDQTSTSKNLPKFNLKVFNENILQNHDQTLVSKPWQYLALKALTKIKVQILYQTSASKSWPNCRQHSINISNTDNLNSSQVGQLFQQQQSVSEWVSQSVSQWQGHTKIAPG